MDSPTPRTTAFAKGDHFVAAVTAQGMTRGQRYVVVDLDQNHTPFGDSINYRDRSVVQ